MTHRRAFVISTALAIGLLSFGLTGCSGERPPAQDSPDAADNSESGLNILILGGTGFIGPHMVRRATERGHTVTLFNRGRSNADMFPDIETLIGDRDGKLEALEGRTWDAVIDNSGYVPRHIGDSAQLLRGAVKQYLFISSISAYADFEQAGMNEDSPLGTMDDETIEEVTGETYGPMKVLGEKAVAEAFPDTTTIVRPGYIVGPGDKSDRWTYWPLRVAHGGEMLIPGTRDDPVQIIDARDLAKFVVHLLESRTFGTFNAVGPADALKMGDMLTTMRSVTGSDAAFTYVDAGTLEENNAVFPIWASPDGEYKGAATVTNDRAKAAGLTFTPLADTVRDTLAWWDTLDAERRAEMHSGLRVVEQEPTGFGSAPMSLEKQLGIESELLKSLDAG